MSTTAKTNLISFKAIVQTVIDTNKEGEPLMKKRADGSEAAVQLCGLKITEGDLANQTIWAQRSLVNREGVVKEGVNKGDVVFATHTSTVNGKPFFEVTTSANASDTDILAALAKLGATTEQATAKVEEVEIPLAQ